ncbi:MAG: zinc ribbon domain-containing protein [Anaerolineales bacterium]|nr:zinc ribbon domain-containing protein [Anaerolineales bacterium]MCB8953363.1 zinc ribbon domain-containing protein [Ardenticatenales bacterium]
MPIYDFHCRECDEVFEERRSFAEAGMPAFCPICGSQDTKKLLASVALRTGSTESIPVPMNQDGGGCCGGGTCGCGL